MLRVCGSDTVLGDFISNTVLEEFWGNMVRDADFGDAVGTETHSIAKATVIRKTAILAQT